VSTTGGDAASLRQQLIAFGAADGRPEVAEQLLRLLDSRPRAFERDEYDDGHFTGSAWLVSADGERALLTHHLTLRLWVQPGGHADGDQDIGRVALREATEESGLTGLVLEPGIFDIDRHAIPARGATPAHHHYDVRFVVRAMGDEQYVVSEESLDLAWRPIIELVDDPAVDASIQRMARRWLARTSPGLRRTSLPAMEVT
jgi:8-oxo-dGTP pyrophosphatase MutT (NUDIX family)